MSLLHAAMPHRRQDHTALRVPVVMPLVEVTIDADGYLEVLLEREPYAADGTLRRADLENVLAGIAADLGTPLRVEVREADGTTFTDIVIPGPEVDRPMAAIGARAAVLGEVSGGGFAPHEEIAVAVVVAHQTADDRGTARLRLPPALLAAHPGLVVLMGQTSGAVVVSGAPA